MLGGGSPSWTKMPRQRTVLRWLLRPRAGPPWGLGLAPRAPSLGHALSGEERDICRLGKDNCPALKENKERRKRSQTLPEDELQTRCPKNPAWPLSGRWPQNMAGRKRGPHPTHSEGPARERWPRVTVAVRRCQVI